MATLVRSSSPVKSRRGGTEWQCVVCEKWFTDDIEKGKAIDQARAHADADWGDTERLRKV